MTSDEPLQILVVDDEDDIRTIVGLALEAGAGWTVHSVDNGQAALEIVEELRPDAILLDVMMPGLDGPTTFAKLKEMPGVKDTPVIFMTAKAQQREVRRYYELGADGVLEKPFDAMTLPERITGILDECGSRR